MTAIGQLASDLLNGWRDDALADELVGWLHGSRRFRAFAETYRDKIRKKLRSAADDESRRDVRAELQAARLLLADRRLALVFEAYGAGKGGPDFSVTFRGERPFNLEVTRPRGVPANWTEGGPILPKLRQLPPSAPNMLLVAADAPSAEAFDAAAAARGLTQRAEASDHAFFTRRGLDGTRGFLQRFQRLGAVTVWCEGAIGDGRAGLWHNPAARIAVPARAARACLLALQAD